jgi:ubiquinone/menaquinone biosynthesis C-methylase UbiE
MGDRAQELDRIRAAFRLRAAGGPPGSSPWLQAAYRLYRQELERVLLEEIARGGLELAGASVLEVGCGGGELLSRFLDYGAGRAAGIDLVEERIEVAGRRYPRLELVAGDASKLPWGNGAFQLVTQFTCLSSVLDRELRVAIASEMWRVLAPGGMVLSYDMCPPAWPLRALRDLTRLYLRHRLPPPGTPVAPLSDRELSALFPRAEVRWRTVGLHPEVARIACRSRLTEQIVVSVPWLRVHAIAVAEKRHDPVSEQ